MGRRLKALEERAGAKLLQRTPTGFALTSAGQAILDNVERIESEVQAVERAISGNDARLEGMVRLTAIEDLTAEVLTPILADFRTRFPGITLELIADSQSLNLGAGEIDVALRLNRFTQGDLVVRKVADFGFAAYASPGYIAAFGLPDFEQGAAHHRLLLPPQEMSDSPQAQWFDAITESGEVALRANSFYMLVAAAEAGMGVVCLPRFLGDTAPLTMLKAPRAAPLRELWLGVHRDIRDAPRFRAITEFLAIGLKRQAPRLNPE